MYASFMELAQNSRMEWEYLLEYLLVGVLHEEYAKKAATN